MFPFSSFDEAFFDDANGGSCRPIYPRKKSGLSRATTCLSRHSAVSVRSDQRLRSASSVRFAEKIVDIKDELQQRSPDLNSGSAESATNAKPSSAKSNLSVAR